MGIAAGLAWLDAADKHVFYLDYGWSSGMLAAERVAKSMNVKIEYRRILKG